MGALDLMAAKTTAKKATAKKASKTERSGRKPAPAPASRPVGRPRTGREPARCFVLPASCWARLDSVKEALAAEAAARGLPWKAQGTVALRHLITSYNLRRPFPEQAIQVKAAANSPRVARSFRLDEATWERLAKIRHVVAREAAARGILWDDTATGAVRFLINVAHAKHCAPAPKKN